ncbi:replication initiator 1-like [Setaria italica]|uniref:replication initiator 1-like n=1 Tax=Setaria italica TaxID=4555 RepID=UPI000350D3F1|nr:replication initiator 1-like [Setaria italica]
MDSSSSRRRPLRDLDGDGDDDDLEEGEYVPGGRDESSDTDGDDDGYRLQRRLEGQLGRGVSWMEVAMASGRPVGVPRPLVARSSCESDGTISDDGSNPSADSSAVVSSAEAPARRFACHVCGRGFNSLKAVDGHMRVHGNGRMAEAAVVGGGWAATGKRGWTGGKPSVAAVCLNSESTDDHSTAVVVAQPIPMAIAVTSSPSSTPVLSSTRTNLSGEESSSSATAQPMDYEAPAVATVVTGPNNPSTGAVVHHQQAAPIPAAEQARPVHQPAVPPPQARPVHQPAVPLPPASLAQPRRVYSCKLCGKSYSSHQGLGGHAAGHRNRQKEAEAAAAAAEMMMGLGQDGAAFRRGRRAEEPHECQKCHKVFATGVALGGHMRMHYTGPPIVHKRNKRRCPAPPPAPAVSEADLRLALSTVTEERRPSPSPAVAAGRVRLFGIDIGPQVQAPPSKEEEQGSSSSEGEKQ